jgi:uncharacterized protein (UPF0335 family)
MLSRTGEAGTGRSPGSSEAIRLRRGRHGAPTSVLGGSLACSRPSATLEGGLPAGADGVDGIAYTGAASSRSTRGVSEDMAQVGGIAGEQLRAFIERIERLEDEKKDVQEQIKEVFSEAKGVGFDTKIMRQLLRLRRLRDADRSEQEELLEIYKAAIGMR